MIHCGRKVTAAAHFRILARPLWDAVCIIEIVLEQRCLAPGLRRNVSVPSPIANRRVACEERQPQYYKGPRRSPRPRRLRAPPACQLLVATRFPERHLLLGSLHGAVDVALAS